MARRTHSMVINGGRAEKGQDRHPFGAINSRPPSCRIVRRQDRPLVQASGNAKVRDSAVARRTGFTGTMLPHTLRLVSRASASSPFPLRATSARAAGSPWPSPSLPAGDPPPAGGRGNSIGMVGFPLSPGLDRSHPIGNRTLQRSQPTGAGAHPLWSISVPFSRHGRLR